ncbi:CotH kinase family protein [bacterium]|nr:CotH kinase family protein [bacterium]
MYEQKTNEKKDDSSQLIQFLKFINTSSDEEFAEGIENWVNVDSVLYLIAIDKLLASNDGFTNGRSNFYLYYHKGEQRFYLLTWDQNLAFGGFGDGNMP